MSKVHVLKEVNGGYQCYIHTNTPAGVNSVNNSWSACYLSAYSPVSQLSVGTGLGQITSSESAAVAAATVLEFQGTIPANADGGAPSSAQVNTFADGVISAGLNSLQAELKYFGYTQ